MQIKRCLSGVLAIMLAAGVSSCGTNEKSPDSSSFTENVKVSETDEIQAIPAGSENELEWFSYFDLNPTKAQPEKSTNLALFEQKGGTIKYTQTTSLARAI